MSRRADIVVAQERLDGPDVVTVLQEVRREGVAEGVAGDALRQASGEGRVTDRALNDRWMDVVAPAR